MVRNLSNSSLVTYKRKSPNYTTIANKQNKYIVIHHTAGVINVRQLGAIFAKASRKASSNYGVQGKNVGLYVPEHKRSWCTSSYAIDSKAVTIETCNSTGAPTWKVSEDTLETLIALCVDICKRNGINKLNFTGDKSGNLHMHKWYAPTGCPGPYLEKQFKYIADQVNDKLGGKKYSKSLKCKFRVTANKLNMRKGASVKYDIVDVLKKGDVVEGTGYYYPNHYQVKHKGKSGWVSKKYIKKI